MVNRYRNASGKFVLRLPVGVHERLRESARKGGLSLNAYCARRLAGDSLGLSAQPGPSSAIARALCLFGDLLIGVAVYGSFARSEAAVGSDVDLLVVLDRGVSIGRNLYRSWDEEEVQWNGRKVDPHFVHLPGAEHKVAGLWAEVALDGIVLLDDSLRLSEMLVQVRRDIVQGRIARRTSHGQPYWVFNEVA